jgi:hypothetical protein
MARATRYDNGFSVTLELNESEFRFLRDLIGLTSPEQRAEILGRTTFERYPDSEDTQRFYRKLCEIEEQ